MEKKVEVCDVCECPEYRLHKIDERIRLCDDCLKANPYYRYALTFMLNNINELLLEEEE